MIALIFVAVLFFIFPFFFPSSYVAELMLSFLPYLLGLSVFFLGVSFVQFRKNMKYRNSKPALSYFRGLAFLVFCGLFLVWSKQFNGFYTTPLPKQSVSS
jgi:protein-S-isoprenylcysteine O-methyltransferase Ste14